ncbi:MAG: dimethylsulfoniopropionate demethylase [Pseudomonadota bacterium]
MSSAILSLSRRIRSTPFSVRVEELGVQAYTVYNHMLLATSFTSMATDYSHLCEHVQIWDVSCERQVELRGPDAARLVQLMTPRDMTKIVVGQCVYAPLVDEAGGMINDPVILKLAEDRYWASIADSDALLWAKGLAYGLGLSVEISEPPVNPVAVQGPKAETLVARVFGDKVRDIRFFRFAWLPFQGHDFLVARSGWSKQGGFEIYVDRDDLALPLWDALWEAGGDLGVGPGCPNLVERIESGLLSYGADMTRENNPYECALDRFCRLDGPDFIGKKALLKIKAEGPARLVRGIKLEGPPVPPCRESWPIFKGDGEANPILVGAVNSAVWSPRFEVNIGIAMMERGHWDLGNQVAVSLLDGTTRQARVCAIPFEDN